VRELEQFQDLQSGTGQALLARIRELDPHPRTLARTSTQLRKQFPPDLVAAALTLHELRARARGKLARANELWLTRAGLEQATSDAIATWRARRYRDIPAVADLCCGIGGDLIALAKRSPHGTVLAVDRDPLHLAMAEANAAVYGVRDRIAFREADVREVDLKDCSGVFIDPARRTGQDRFAAGRSEPPLEWCLALPGRVANVGIKAAPGIPRDLVPLGWELETIALGTDLKEAVLWSPAMAEATSSATVIRDDRVHHLRPVPGAPVPARIPEAGEILLDPNPAITRAGLVEDLARFTGSAKLDGQLAFLVCATAVTTPFARSLPIVASMPWNEKQLRARLRELGGGPIDVRRRGLAGDVDAITRRLRGEGSRPFTLAMTRVRDEPWALICEDPERV
jgi:SAM-dependent methyltransferase